MYTLNLSPTFPDFSPYFIYYSISLVVSDVSHETLSAHWFNYPIGITNANFSNYVHMLRSRTASLRASLDGPSNDGRIL